uniref:Putative stress-activated map kinase-interacting protein 1 n=1 Tax=Triatoma infestans TaxID=30076 RepID=A0A023F2U5_TRIIF
MALYDNKHWLLSHIRNSFITSDDSGMCDVVMVCDNIARQIPVDKYDCYPGIEQDEDDDDIDALAQSFDLNSDLQFGLRRHRSNTAQRLEKLEEEKKKSANTMHIKWVDNPVPLSDEERARLFPEKDITKIREESKLAPRISLLTEMLAKCPNMPENPFKEYAKLDGNAHVGVPIKKYLIFITMLSGDKRKYPMEVAIVNWAKVLDLIGLVCWKCSIEHTEIAMKDNVNHYGLFIAEDDGDVDWDFPCLNSSEAVGKFGFTYLALVEREKSQHHQEESYPIYLEGMSQPLESTTSSTRAQLQFEDDLQKLKGHMTALEAPLYQSFNVHVVNKVRARTEVYLEISYDKLEMYPVMQPHASSGRIMSGRLWGSRQKAELHSMDDVVACDLTEHKSNSRSSFRLVYYQKREGRSHEESGKFKTRDFEAKTAIATEIVKKVNNILDVRQSARRKEYAEHKERKSLRRKNFNLGPR